MIRAVKESDARAVVDIYNHYVAHTAATFEEIQLGAAEMSRRIASIRADNLPWLVAEEEGALIGYAYAGKWQERSAYRYSVESTVYMAPNEVGGGWGTRLYAALFDQLRTMEIHAVIGGITLPNPASIALHEKMGMSKVAHFPEVGFKQGEWLDVGYWQLTL